MTKEQNRTIWILILSSSLILAITMGVRQSLGLFIAPINSSTSLDIISISLALAIGQFIWGLTQPIFGAIADKKGSFGVLVFGALLMFFGLIINSFFNFRIFNYSNFRASCSSRCGCWKFFDINWCNSKKSS